MMAVGFMAAAIAMLAALIPAGIVLCRGDLGRRWSPSSSSPRLSSWSGLACPGLPAAQPVRAAGAARGADVRQRAGLRPGPGALAVTGRDVCLRRPARPGRADRGGAGAGRAADAGRLPEAALRHARGAGRAGPGGAGRAGPDRADREHRRDLAGRCCSWWSPGRTCRTPPCGPLRIRARHGGHLEAAMSVLALGSHAVHRGDRA